MATITISGVDRSSSYTQEEFGDINIVKQADQGQVGIGTAPVPSDDTSDEAYSGQSFVFESDGQTVLDGFVGPMNLDRNGVVSDGRVTFHYTIADENALLGGHRAVKWVRPSETDRDRILAAIDEFLDYLSLDVSMVLATHEETLPAKTYMTEDIFGELQTDCGEPTAKDMFIESRRFHWHRQDEGDDNGISIVAREDADNVTSFYLDSSSPPVFAKDGMELITDVLARNDTQTYQTDDPTAQARHDADGIRHEALIEDSDATLAQLTTRANRMLATFKSERRSYEGVVGPLTTAQALLFVPGSLITVTEPVWRLSGSTQRIAGVQMKYMHPDLWMVTLQLGYTPRLRLRPLKSTSKSSEGTGEDSGGGQAECCTPWACDPFDVGSLSCLARDTNTYSYTEGGFRSSLGGATLGMDGNYHFISTDFTSYFRTGGPVTSQYPLAMEDCEMGNGGAAECIFTDGLYDYLAGGVAQIVRIRVIGPGTLTIQNIGHPGGHSGPCPSGGTIEALASVSGGASAIASASGPVGTPLVIVVPDMDECAYFIDIDVPGGSWGYGGANWTPNVDGLPACLNGLPNPGQPVHDPTESTTGDGVTTTDTTTHSDKFGYKAGSLEVFVNGHLFPGVIETDPDLGTIEYTYPPPLGSDVVRLYDRGTLVS